MEVLNIEYWVEKDQPYFKSHYYATARAMLSIDTHNSLIQETEVLCLDIEVLYNHPIIFLN